MDTGPTYTIVPANLLQDLGNLSIDKIGLVLADGCPGEYKIGAATSTGNERTIPTLMVLGEDDAPAQMGTYTQGGCR